MAPAVSPPSRMAIAAAAPAEAFEHPVLRIGRGRQAAVALGLDGVGAHAGAAREYAQRLGPDLLQAEPLGGGQGGPGVGVHRVKLPPAGMGRGELEIEDGRGAHRAHLLGGAPRLG